MTTSAELRFLERSAAASARPSFAGDWTEVAALARTLAGVATVVISPTAAAGHPDLADLVGPPTLVPSDDTDPEAVADCAVGIVIGRLAVAETGSVVLEEDRIGDRLVSMLAVQLVQAVERHHVVESLDDVAAWLDARGPGAGHVTLSTGPSRTADIERSLTIGVQGPSEVHVVVVG